MSRISEPIQTVTLRSRFGIALTVAVWLICLISVITLGTDQGLADALRYAPAFVLVGYACWMTFWAPSVSIDPSGVSLRNIVRTHRVTWPAIQRIDTKYALTLFVADGKFTAWSAPAPSRFSMMNAHKQDLHALPESSYGPGMSLGLGDLPKSDSGVAAYYVRTEWEALRDAGHLDLGIVEGRGVVTTWHRRELLIAALLLALALGLGYL